MSEHCVKSPKTLVGYMWSCGCKLAIIMQTKLIWSLLADFRACIKTSWMVLTIIIQTC